ncbi:MAG: hypothetical protein EH225_11595 [Calditrichaeota bacterium]|nr:hypothetical protein [Calditrichota bacterium]RQV99425.1 MAG: hypothetical protein EH225_11595 [Calditrichota bacterium]
MEYNEEQAIRKVEEARRLFAEGNYPEALRHYRELTDILSEDKENLPVIQIETGWAYYNNQQYQESIDMLESALKHETLSPQQIFDCYRILGYSRELSGKRHQAIKDLEKAVQVPVPEEVKRYAYFELGKIFFTDGQMIEAEHYLQRTGSLFTEEEQLYCTALSYYLGFIEYFQKKYDSAQKHFNRVIQDSDDHKTRASGYFGLAHIHYHRQEYPILIDLCEKILRLDSSFFDKETLGFFMCEAYYHLKEWDCLENYFSELKKNFPRGRYASAYSKFDYTIQHKKTPPSEK